MDAEDLDKLSDNWYCNECEHKRLGSKKSKVSVCVSSQRQGRFSYAGQSKKAAPKYTGMFRELIEDMDKRNPLEYRLPNDIINFFEHGRFRGKREVGLLAAAYTD